MVHERRIQETGEVVNLKVSGKVRLGNLIMFDERTGSEWLQETGKSLDGDHQGKSLTDIAPQKCNSRIRWDEWRELHPDSQVLVCPHCDKAGRK